MSAQNPLTGFEDNYEYSPYNGAYALKSYNTQSEADAAFGKEYVSSGDSLWEKISDALFGTNYKTRYDNWLANQDRAYERAAINSARAFDTWFDSTQIQRRVKDIEAAGLNPWLAVQSGVSGGSGYSTASSGSSARSYHKGDKNSNALGQIAMAVMATAKIMALLG